MKAVYLAVAGRIRRELSELDQVVERIERIWQRRTAMAEAETDDYYIDAIALNLHGFYAGIERLLEVIAEGVDQTKPTGASWHRELLQQLTTDIPSVRPAVLSFETRDRLDRYRGFRHVVRNVYTFNLDPEQIGLLIQQLQPTKVQVSQELLNFADWLEQVASVEN
ncbi:MAG: hypothetical protein Kow00121_09080 [Elainellaceae cyanobacterium]